MPRDRGGFEGSDAADATMRAAMKGVAITAAVLSVIVGFGWGARPAIGTFTGGAIATLNLWVFAMIGEALLRRRNRAAWMVIAVLKLGALLGGVYAIIKSGVVPPGWLALGYASLPIGITLGSILRPPVDPPDPGPPGPDPQSSESAPPTPSDPSDSPPKSG